MNSKVSLAQKFLEIKAVRVEAQPVFRWASGILSPIYCDNRKILSYPEIRSIVTEMFAEQIRNNYPDVEVIAGVATGGIAFGVLTANKLGLPFVYVRSTAKDHGLKKQLEGDLRSKARVVVIEDLISTGKSSLNAVDVLRQQGADIMGLISVFSYNLQKAKKNFDLANCGFTSLTNVDELLLVAEKNGLLGFSDIRFIKSWLNQL